MSTLKVHDEEAFWAPSNFCQWTPTSDGRGIESDGGEKFYGYVGWLRFLLEHFLLPWGYELSGEVSYRGEQGEHGRIIVTHHEVQKVVDGDSLLPRSKESDEIGEVKKVCWMTLSSVSDGARQAILDIDGVVLNLHDDPPVVLVGLPYDSNYHKRFGYDDLAIWTTEGISLSSKKLRLEWIDKDFPETVWKGFPDMGLILPGEVSESPLLW